MVIIGIVGFPAGGKSTVARRLAELGATWINADAVAHDVLRMPRIIEELTRHFGDTLVSADGQIDRRRLGGLVFGDDDAKVAALRYLESVVHPPTRQEMLRQIARADRQRAIAVILDVPLLLESGWSFWCDEIWFVDTAFEIRIANATARGWSGDQLRWRERMQATAIEKNRWSTVSIRNESSLETLLLNVDRHWNERVLCRSGAPPDPEHCRALLTRGEY